MILWTVVLNKLKPYCPDGTATIEDALTWLYQVRGLSLREITALAEGYASATSIKSKLKELGLPIRRRGGAHKPVPTLTREEVETVPAKQLALKYGVTVNTIYAKRRALLKQTRRCKQAKARGVRAPLFDDTFQE